MSLPQLKDLHDRVFFKALVEVIQGAELKFVEIGVNGKKVVAIYCNEPAFMALKFTMDQFLETKRDDDGTIAPSVVPLTDPLR